MLRRPPLVALALVVLLPLSVAACRSSSTGDQTPTPAVTPTLVAVATPPQAAPSATATPSTAIRLLDLKAAPPVQKLLTDTGGQFVPSEVIYADLTGDGAEDAIVPISSGGTLGDLAFVVLAATGGTTRTLVSEYPNDGRGLSVAVVGGKLVETQPVPGPDDPECCPSELRKTTYAWNGVTLAIESVVTVPNPNAGPKPTPAGPPVNP